VGAEALLALAVGPGRSRREEALTSTPNPESRFTDAQSLLTSSPTTEAGWLIQQPVFDPQQNQRVRADLPPWSCSNNGRSPAATPCLPPQSPISSTKPASSATTSPRARTLSKTSCGELSNLRATDPSPYHLKAKRVALSSSCLLDCTPKPFLLNLRLTPLERLLTGHLTARTSRIINVFKGPGGLTGKISQAPPPAKTGSQPGMAPALPTGA
jgi:hypothetical protein